MNEANVVEGNNTYTTNEVTNYTEDPDVTEPDPDVTEPDPDVTEPDPDVTEPDPDVTEPDPDVTEPDPDATEPDPDVHKAPQTGDNVNLWVSVLIVSFGGIVLSTFCGRKGKENEE